MPANMVKGKNADASMLTCKPGRNSDHMLKTVKYNMRKGQLSERLMRGVLGRAVPTHKS